jgi:hypothetical protein
MLLLQARVLLLVQLMKDVCELWISRTPWEKRRQLSAVIQRAIAMGRPVFLLSCDDWTTFLGRIDLAATQVNEALMGGQMEYLQFSTGGSDLSRTLGELGPISRGKGTDLVIVDDVDLIIDLSSSHSAAASLFALIYALHLKFQEITLFSNPLRSGNERVYLEQMHDFIAVHGAI